MFSYDENAPDEFVTLSAVLTQVAKSIDYALERSTPEQYFYTINIVMDIARRVEMLYPYTFNRHKFVKSCGIHLEHSDENRRNPSKETTRRL